MSKRYHVTKRGDGWAVKREGSKKASKVHKTKEGAKKDAQKYREKGNDVVIHKKDGTIEKWQKKK
ncbi:MAG: DUF2188 domain-containing protein [Thermosipho sp. (in: Bacteria)]|nr:DUF2188 domain-containing protein [Thermosipho sp. (in: thermotogales)]